MSDTHYFHRRHLAAFSTIGRGQAALADKFFSYYGAVFADGALSVREKALTALAVAHVVQCPYCIDAYTKGSLEAGADLEQMTEAVHVGAAVRAASILLYGMQMANQAGRVQMGGPSGSTAPAYFERGHLDAWLEAHGGTTPGDGASDGAGARMPPAGALGAAHRAYDDAVFADGALDRRDKGLIALACAHALQCAYSIDRAVRLLGAEKTSLEEMTEAVHVATAIRGGASLVHGIQMLEHLQASTED